MLFLFIDGGVESGLGLVLQRREHAAKSATRTAPSIKMIKQLRVAPASSVWAQDSPTHDNGFCDHIFSAAFYFRMKSGGEEEAE